MTSDSAPPLCWLRQDIEQRCLFKGGKHTRVNSIFAALAGTAIFVAAYAISLPFRGYEYVEIFWDWVPAVIVFFGCWSIAILFVKSRKLAFQKKTLRYRVTPKESDFILSGGNVDTVFDNLYSIVDDPRYFILFNRITVALSNLKNLGRIGDVGEILQAQAEQDEAAVDTSYSVINGFIWAIPVLGFIGTVLGLSGAIGGFGAVLDQADNFDQMKDNLRVVTNNLSLAFVTTLQALVVALGLQLWLTFLKKSEEEFLEDCAVYCTKHVVNRLRIQPFSQDSHDQ